MAYNEPAFPFEYEGDGGQRVNHAGMGLRDYFAGKALSGLLTRASWDQDLDLPKLARYSYKLADAMLDARSSQDRQP